MGVNQGCFYVFMSKQFLDSTNIVAVFQQICGKTVTERMAAYFFGNLGSFCGLFNGSLEDFTLDMVTFDFPIPRIDSAMFCRKDKSPNPLMVDLGIFSG